MPTSWAANPIYILEEESQYKAIRNFCLNILKKYPPEKFFYVGIGRSPTPLMSCLDGLNIPYKNVPVSDLRRDNFEAVPKAKMQEFMHQVFDRYFPGKEEVGGKKVLMLDFVYNGKTLVRTNEYLDSYMKKSGREEAVKALAMIGGDDKDHLYDHEIRKRVNKAKELLAKNQIDTILLRRGTYLSEQFFNEGFDRYAQYDHFPVWDRAEAWMKGKKVKWPQPEKDYDRFNKALKALMLKDSSLKKYFQTPKAGGKTCPQNFSNLNLAP